MSNKRNDVVPSTLGWQTRLRALSSIEAFELGRVYGEKTEYDLEQGLPIVCPVCAARRAYVLNVPSVRQRPAVGDNIWFTGFMCFECTGTPLGVFPGESDAGEQPQPAVERSPA